MWKKREAPSRVEKRFEFDQYQSISEFMKMVDELCKEKNIYPNISFGKNFVSISIFLDSKTITKVEEDFSNQIDKCFLKFQDN